MFIVNMPVMVKMSESDKDLLSKSNNFSLPFIAISRIYVTRLIKSAWLNMNLD